MVQIYEYIYKPKEQKRKAIIWMLMETLYIRRAISQMCEVNMDLWINDLGSNGIREFKSISQTYINPKLIKDLSVKK